MTDKHITVGAIRWQNVLPWLHLLKAILLALRFRVWLLGLLSVFVLAWGSLALESLPFVGGGAYVGPSGPLAPASPGIKHFKNEQSLGMTSSTLNAIRKGDAAGLHSSLTADLFWPVEMLGRPLSMLSLRYNTWSVLAQLWTWVLFALIAWGVLAGAMTRMIGVRFAREESVSLRAALMFSLRNWQSYVYGPLLPILGVLLFAGVASGFGFLSSLCASFSPALAKAIASGSMLCGLAMSALLLLTLVSWPLMVVAISVEGSDGFDGLSRAFGYVMNRPWYLLLLVLLTKFVVAFGIAVPWIVCETSGWFVEWSLNWSVALDGAQLRLIPEFWTSFAHGLQLAIVVAFFWSATTVIYFLLRHSDDGTPLDQVYIPGPPPSPEVLPLVGVAASAQPVIERPATEVEPLPPAT